MIITLDRVEQVQDAIGMSLIDKTRYVCIATENGDIVIQPTVTTKGRNTYILLKQPLSAIEKCTEIFGKIIKVKSITFRDETFSL